MNAKTDGGWVRLKRWCVGEAARRFVVWEWVAKCVRAGRFVNLEIRRSGQLVEVREVGEVRLDTELVNGETPMKQWIIAESARSGLSTAAVYARLTRNPGRYCPGVRVRRLNARVAHVSEVAA